MWVKFVVCSRPCSERFFSGYSGFPLSSKTNISRFLFDLDYYQAIYHEPLAREIALALPVLLTLNKLLELPTLLLLWIVEIFADFNCLLRFWLQLQIPTRVCHLLALETV